MMMRSIELERKTLGKANKVCTGTFEGCARKGHKHSHRGSANNLQNSRPTAGKQFQMQRDFWTQSQD
jgi:hypothetical protein